jgi:hypothetical protein
MATKNLSNRLNSKASFVKISQTLVKMVFWALFGNARAPFLVIFITFWDTKLKFNMSLKILFWLKQKQNWATDDSTTGKQLKPETECWHFTEIESFVAKNRAHAKTKYS